MASEIRTFLAEQVIDRRKRAKLSQAALSAQTGLSIARISEIERAIANPTLDTLEALAGVFNVSVVDLLDYESALTSVDKIRENIAGTLGKFDEKRLRAVFAMVRGIRK